MDNKAFQEGFLETLDKTAGFWDSIGDVWEGAKTYWLGNKGVDTGAYSLSKPLQGQVQAITDPIARSAGKEAVRGVQEQVKPLMKDLQEQVKPLMAGLQGPASNVGQKAVEGGMDAVGDWFSKYKWPLIGGGMAAIGLPRLMYSMMGNRQQQPQYVYPPQGYPQQGYQSWY